VLAETVVVGVVAVVAEVVVAGVVAEVEPGVVDVWAAGVFGAVTVRVTGGVEPPPQAAIPAARAGARPT
jgi:hypothetical protein